MATQTEITLPLSGRQFKISYRDNPSAGEVANLKRFSLFMVGLAAPFLGGVGPNPSPPGARPVAAGGNVLDSRHVLAAHTSANASATSTPPAIISGRIRDANVNIGTGASSPAISFTFKTGPEGLFGAGFEFLSPSGRRVDIYLNGFASTASFGTSGTYTIQNPELFGLYAEAGTYTLVNAGLETLDSATNYSGSQLTALFPSLTFTVINSHSDTSAPTVSAGRITHNFSLQKSPPVLNADLTVADSGSGVYEAIISILDPSGDPYYLYYYAPHPVIETATIPLALNFQNSAPTPVAGIYNISEIEIFDYAGNIKDVKDEATIKVLFGSDKIHVTD